MANLAAPEANEVAPAAVPSIIKVTEPVGLVVPVAGAAVAVNVMTAPAVPGLELADRVVLVATCGPWLIVSVSVPLVLTANGA